LSATSQQAAALQQTFKQQYSAATDIQRSVGGSLMLALICFPSIMPCCWMTRVLLLLLLLLQALADAAREAGLQF
jgi:hypothetical protein